MGTIHLAVAGGLADFRKLLVVKELRQDFAANQRFVEMFLDEAKLAARLNHPNVVQTIEAGQEGDRYFLSMEFLDGQPYSAIWSAANQFPQISLGIRLKVLCDALAGLHYAHTLSEYDGTKLHIVHRDVSPQNIFVTYDGQVKVVDFGIAKAAVSSTATTPGLFKGKFGYAAPEQVRGEMVDARTDVFAMGVILWEALAMQRFCDGVVSRDAVAMRLAGQEPRAARLRPAVDPRLAAICDRALAVEPDARFASADEFRQELESYLARTNQRVDAAAIQQVLAQKFAAERRVVHQLIDRHLKHGVVEESAVSHIALGAEAGNNQPTQVADLSNYVRNTNETVVSGVALAPPREPEPPPRRLGMIVGIVALVALALGVGVWLGTQENAQPAPVASPTRAPAAANPAAALPAPAQSARGASLAAMAATPEAAATQAGPAEKAEVSAPPTAAPEVEDTAEVRQPAGARPAPRRVARSRAAPGAASPATAEQAAPAQASAPAPAAPAVRVEPVAPHPPAKAAVGVDLNSLGRHDSHRAIDTEL